MPQRYAEFKTSSSLEFELLSLGARVVDLSVPMEKISKRMEEEATASFSTGGQGTWAIHDPDTTERHGDHPLLIDSGGLRDSLERVWSRSNAAVLTYEPHAHLMALGTKKPGGGAHTPGREFLEVIDEALDTWAAQQVWDYVLPSGAGA